MGSFIIKIFCKPITYSQKSTKMIERLTWTKLIMVEFYKLSMPNLLQMFNNALPWNNCILTDKID